MRSCNTILTPNRHVRSGVSNPWDPEVPFWCLVGMFDLMFPTREILQPRPDTSYACWNCCSLPVRACSPTRIPRRHVRFDILTREILQPRPVTSYACWIYCSKPVRSCSPVLIPRRHVQSGLTNQWYLAAPAWHVLQPRPDTSYACWNIRRTCLVGMYDLQFRTCEILQPRPDMSCSPVLIPLMHVGTVVPNPWDPAASS